MLENSFELPLKFQGVVWKINYTKGLIFLKGMLCRELQGAFLSV